MIWAKVNLFPFGGAVLQTAKPYTNMDKGNFELFVYSYDIYSGIKKDAYFTIALVIY